jgi:adenylyl-sulfate kinase
VNDQPPAKPVSKDVLWSPSLVESGERVALLRQRGSIVWLTGLSGAGKSTIAHALEAHLIHQGCFAYVLDGDNIRHGLNRDLGFSEEDRHENIRRVSEVACLFADAGAIVIVSFITPYAADRAAARAIAGKVPFIETHIHADIKICESRDPKGLYRKARAGLIRGFTGIDAPYEAPEHPDVRLDTSALSVAEAVERVMAVLSERGVFRPGSA